MLNPNDRCLYTSALTPPAGMAFDEAIATTFSMDPTILLEAPVYLALMGSAGRSAPDPLSMLGAIRGHAKRITAYVQRGRIQIPQAVKSTPLFGLLEQMIIEVRAPQGGIFHPKVWAIRFVGDAPEKVRYRLLILTRNMTADRSWDLALQLDGQLSEKEREENRPLEHFFKHLPPMAAGVVDSARKQQARKFSREVRRVQWELPEGFDRVAFYLPGTPDYGWDPPDANRLAVISPFCSDSVLQTLAKKAKSAEALISRPETLAALGKETRGLFRQCHHLDDAAETEDGEEGDALSEPLATGLHAKVYLFETKHYADDTHVVVGSANATNAAMLSRKNVEILAELVGRKRNVGGIDELLGADGLGEYLVSFVADGVPEVDEAKREAEECVERARDLIAGTPLRILCRPAPGNGLWKLLLDGNMPPLPGIISAVAWPITVPQGAAADILRSAPDGSIPLGEFSASSLTGLTAFELKASHPEVSGRFVLNLPVEGMPEDRNTAILQTIINNQAGFLRYLLLLLADGETLPGALRLGQGPGGWASSSGAGDDIPLLEDLTRAFCRQPERLADIDTLLRDLAPGGQNTVVPPKFMDLWKVFADALEKRHG